MTPDRKASLRRDIETWAQEIGYTPQMSVEDPETIIDFMDECLRRYPDQYSLEHASEIFKWCGEYMPHDVGGAPQ